MRTIPAIYENGVFKPQEPISLPPGAKVEVSLPEDRDPVEIMRERFPLSFGALSDEDAEAPTYPLLVL
jgi:predicted DNA-binding antitoxin AbrB/MazE fold protein